MEAFATPAQYRAKYTTELDDETLAEWLGSASRVMRGELGASGIDYSDPDDVFADELMDICRDVAHRAISDDGDDGGMQIPYGATQVNMSAGSYSRGASFGTSGYASLFLTAAEKLALGIGMPKACIVSPYGGA